MAAVLSQVTALHCQTLPIHSISALPLLLLLLLVRLGWQLTQQLCGDGTPRTAREPTGDDQASEGRGPL
jgi:hypothetical protein